MKKNLLCAALLAYCAQAMAVPALPVKRTITLPNGQQKIVVLRGDENGHFFQDADNNAFLQRTDGSYERISLPQFTAQWNQRFEARNEHRLARAQQKGLGFSNGKRTLHKAQWGAEQNPVSGKKKGLVILVNFSDKKMNTAHGQQFYDGFFNTIGFSQGGGKGSVHDYFLESSYGQLDLTFDVVGPVTVSKSMSYYGSNDQYGADMYPATMVAEACQLADAQGVDFTKYDWDTDGQVDQVFVVYAGYGESMGAPATTIWPHESTLSDGALFGDGKGSLTLDNVTINTYAVTCEMFGTNGTTAAGIGTACHEFSHCMCLPDMYDLEGINFGMGPWDLMDFGSYNGTSYGLGNSPATYTSYERMYCGWLNPKELSAPTLVTDLPDLNDAPEAYILRNEKSRNEYYLLENRQQKGFDACLPSHGLLVLHVNFDSQTWADNEVNTGNVQCMTVIPADNTLNMEDANGDTWPGKSKNTALTDTSRPAATLYNANADGRKYMGHPIEDIAEKNGLVSFTFDGGQTIPAPMALEATDIQEGTFTANWMAVDEANRYEVQLVCADLGESRHSLSEVTTMTEDFHGFNNGGTANGLTDVSKQIDNYTTIPGWESQNIYTTPRNEIRIGDSKAGGYIISPWLTTEGKVITVSFTIRSYSSDTEPVYLVMGEGTEGGPVAYMTPTKEAEQYVITASSDTNDWWFGLSCEARCYVSEMSAYEGHITEEEVAQGYINTQLTETTTVQTADTHYTFANLAADKAYTYKVRAWSDKARSEWSNEVNVTLPSAIEDIQVPLLPAVDGIYNLAGQRLPQLQKGINIVRGKKVLK